jgi:hypothetical protein
VSQWEPLNTNFSPAAPLTTGEVIIEGAGLILVGGPPVDVIWRVDVASIMCSLNLADLACSSELCLSVYGTDEGLTPFIAVACSVSNSDVLLPTINKNSEMTQNLFYIMYPVTFMMRGEVAQTLGGTSSMAAVISYSVAQSFAF